MFIEWVPGAVIVISISEMNLIGIILDLMSPKNSLSLSLMVQIHKLFGPGKPYDESFWGHCYKTNTVAIYCHFRLNYHSNIYNIEFTLIYCRMAVNYPGV